MARKAQLTVVFLHQVELDQPFYCCLSDQRAWIKCCPTGALSSRFATVPVERGGVKAHMNAMAHVWIQAQSK